MSGTDTGERKSAIRAVVRRLSQARAEEQATARKRFKEGSARRRAVLERLGAGPATVPELAAGTGIAAEEVLVIVATLRRYGAVAEDEQQDSYFRYRLTEPAGEA
jgi:predicted Rossmann fold nucleotide-binding protein DprA/Smf involved in DNA uptake